MLELGCSVGSTACNVQPPISENLRWLILKLEVKNFRTVLRAQEREADHEYAMEFADFDHSRMALMHCFQEKTTKRANAGIQIRWLIDGKLEACTKKLADHISSRGCKSHARDFA